MSLMSRCAKKLSSSKSNFSIDHILNVAGKKSNFGNYSFSIEADREETKFEWLNCTRYRPPKLQRQRKKEGIQRRKLGRNPRIPFSSSQVAFLEAKFLRTPYLSSTDVTQLASYLKLSETRVKIWFQNRRAREKRDKDLKSKLTENGVQSLHLTPKLSPEKETEPFSNESFHANSSNCSTNQFTFLNYINFAHSENYLQLVTPLDLSDRQIVYKSK